jgi:hypothetical protein
MSTGDLVSRADAFVQVVDRIGRTLLELDDDGDRQMCEQATFTGDTATRWTEARLAIADLWSSFETLTKVAERVRWLRSKNVDPRRHQDLEAVLDGPSIGLRADRLGPVDRGLLDATTLTQRISPPELVHQMTEQYERVRAVIASISGAWTALVPRVHALQAAVEDASRLTDEIGEHASPELLELGEAARSLAVGALEDPLSADEALLQSTESRAANLSAGLRTAASLKAGLVAVLADADQRRAALRRADEAVQTAQDLALAKIEDPGDAGVALDTTAVERGWAEVVDAIDGKQWAAAGAALAVWHQAVDEQLVILRSAEAHWRSSLAERDELRGRLEALRAMAIGLGHAEHPVLDAMYEQAWSSLYVAPCDLPAARRLVGDYGAALADAGRGGGS